MARTKKFLASSAGMKTTRSFYRPLKRTSLPSYPSLNNSINIARPKRVQVVSSLIHEESTSTPVSDKQHIIQADQPRMQTAPQVSVKSKQIDTFISLDNPIENQETTANTPKSVIGHNSSNNHQLLSSANTEPSAPSYDNYELSQEIEKLEHGVENSIQKDQKIAAQLKEMQQQFEKEKEKMETTIHVLKKEISHQQPLRENKFFSISKELKDITEAMNRLVENEAFDTTSPTVIQPTVITSTGQTSSADISKQIQVIAGKTEASEQPTKESQNAESKPQTESQAITQTDSIAPVNQDTSHTPVKADTVPVADEMKPKPKKRIPKPIAILATTLLLMGCIGGLVWYSFNKKPEVSTQLIQEYLPPDAKTPSPTSAPQEEKKIDSSENKEQTTTPPSPTKVQGATDEKYIESQADVSYDETLWDAFKDPTIGVEINYPKNAVNVVKTETSLTFLRKTGYIFKVQVFETALDVNEYWKSIKANSLNYKIKETTFREEKALFLELEDMSDYPGDRYLIKRGDYVFDVWYATYSNTLSDDDMKRVEVMLNSFKFI